MKTNKLWSIMMMLVLVLGTAIAFSSCSKDDDDKIEINDEPTMIGKWKYSWDDGYGLLTLNPDGSGTYFEYDDGEIDSDYTPFYWSYEETGSILVLKWTEGGQVTHEGVFPLTWINKKSFTADLMDRGSIWIKQ